MSNPEASLADSVAIVEANLSMPLGHIFTGGLHAHEDYLSAVGADGMQITPVAGRLVRTMVAYGAALENHERNRTPVELRGPSGHFGSDLLSAALDTPAPRRGYASEAIGRLVHSVHESFRRQVDDNGLSALPFPRSPESVSQMRHIQAATGRELLAVLYPGLRSDSLVRSVNPRSPIDEGLYAPFDNTFQSKQEDFAGLGLSETSSTDGISRAARVYGYSGLTWDVCHAQKFNDPLALCERLAAAGLIRSIHLSVGRKDQAKHNPKIAETTEQADRAFMDSPEAAARTLEGEMVVAVLGHWKQQSDPRATAKEYSVVLEKPFRVNPRKAQRQDRATFETTRALIAAA